jgi:chromosome segregation protein
LQVNRLRLSGFKSFVDATEFPIEPGLTGVIGPNGCGKSNLLEALRWVMGAASAKAMRGEAMEDVIFAGAAGRAARSHAEVTLTLDNSDRTGPAAYAATPILDVTRRIDRGQGSSYRINGAEARARDVQLLFADASTGANSPALVRQGQISELIAARPQNRRRILEEAAGVAGLHGRRHEALLRVNAAEANLQRLEDLAREVEASQTRLKREARVAARYKFLASEIRKVDGALGLARWTEAARAREAAHDASKAAAALTLETARAAAAASAALLRADEPLARLRDDAVVAAAVSARLTLEMDRTERDLKTARADAERLSAEIARILTDLEREGRIGDDATAALERLAADIARHEREIAAEPARGPELKIAAEAAEQARSQADQIVESLAARLAAAESERRAAAARATDARSRNARSQRALEEIKAERASMGRNDDAPLLSARETCGEAARREAEAREALERAENERGDAARLESDARAVMRQAADALSRTQAAAQGLAQITRTVEGDRFQPVLDQISVDAGLEAALAAALGDDLSAPVDGTAPASWDPASPGRDPVDVVWPDGVTPLSAGIRAPAALSARLALIGLTDRAHGPRLQKGLPPGARLVSPQGDLWRWDGFRTAADAPRPAQARLEQRNRLAALEAQIADLKVQSDLTRATHEAAAARLTDAEAAVRQARAAPAVTASVAAQARDRLLVLEREAALREARIQALDQTLVRLEVEDAETSGSAEAAEAALAAIQADGALAQDLAAARTKAAVIREQAFAARSALEREEGARAARARRLDALRREAGEWRERAAGAQARVAGLNQALARARADLDTTRERPQALERRRLDLTDESEAAAAREAGAARALASAEAERSQGERDARAADAKAADARAARAAADAHLEAATERLESLARALRESTGLCPEDLARNLAADALALPPEAGGVETHLEALKADLANLGQVNLRAEEDLAELSSRLAGLATERADLDGALARLRRAIEELEAEGRERLTAAFHIIDGHFRDLFTTLFEGGAAELRLVESADPLESGLEIFACPPGKRLAVMSLMSGGEQALTAVALIFAVFLSNPAPLCVLDEVDAPLDDANVERFCNLLDEMRRRAATRFLTITHNPLTMSRMDRLFGVTMRERGVSQLVSVDLSEARRLAAS